MILQQRQNCLNYICTNCTYLIDCLQKNKFGPIYTILDRFRLHKYLVYTNSKKFENQFQKNWHKNGPNWTSLNQSEQYQTTFSKKVLQTCFDQFFKTNSRKSISKKSNLFVIESKHSTERKWLWSSLKKKWSKLKYKLILC